jgi:hypothetical protein
MSESSNTNTRAELELEVLRHQLRGYETRWFMKPPILLSAAATMIAVIGVAIQGAFSTWDYKIADLKMAQLQVDSIRLEKQTEDMRRELDAGKDQLVEIRELIEEVAVLAASNSVVDDQSKLVAINSKLNELALAAGIDRTAVQLNLTKALFLRKSDGESYIATRAYGRHIEIHSFPPGATLYVMKRGNWAISDDFSGPDRTYSLEEFISHGTKIGTTKGRIPANQLLDTCWLVYADWSDREDAVTIVCAP